MKEIDDLADKYPEHKDLLKETRQKIKDIDLKIEQLPPDKSGPRLEYNVPGQQTSRPFGTQNRDKESLQGQKEHVEREFDERVDERLVNKSPEVKAQTKSDLKKILSSKDALKIDKKDLDVSQDSINKKMDERRAEAAKHPVTERLMGGKPSHKGQDTKSMDEKEPGTSSAGAQPSISDQLMKQANATRDARIEKNMEQMKDNNMTKDVRDHDRD